MKVLSFDDLKTVKGIRFTKAWLYKLIKDNRFPQPIKLGGNSTGFVESEIDAWIASRIADRDGKAA